MKELKYNIKYIFSRKELYIAFIGVLIVNLLHIYFVIKPNIQVGIISEFAYTAEYNTIMYGLYRNLSSVVIVVFPVLCSMIIGDSTWLDIHSKRQNLLFMRLNIKKLIIQRWYLSIIIPFLITFVGLGLNYITLISFLGSGNKMTFAQGVAYSLREIPGFFLDKIRIINPVLFIILIIIHVSFIMGLLSAITFTFSLFTKYRIIIYFQILLFVILSDVIMNMLGLPFLCVISQLNPFSNFSHYDALILYVLLFFISIIPMYVYFLKKDILL